MKKFQLLKWTLALVVFINFSACVNEALEGDFPQNGDIINYRCRWSLELI